ncbi:MAG: xylulokinase [Acidobacteria bacterium]|jgi:xylulokinase|nr:xylulokinase [Acidobacteriota bacterium]
MGQLFLGVDVSTTGAKALLIDEGGKVVATATTALSLQTPKPLWSEQDPQEWWSGTAASIRKALADAGAPADDVAAVGLTGQMHGLVLLDGDRNVLRPAILWNDQRTGAECEEIEKRVGRSELIHEVGNVALTGFTAPKILWVRNNEPDVYAKAKLVLLPKDYVRLRLTGEAAMDRAGGSGTILFELKARNWSKAVLDKLDIPADWLPPTFEGPEITGKITAEAAEATGLAEGTPVMAGGGDQAAGAVGAGAVRPGVVSLTLGTSGVIFATTDAPLVEPEGRLHAFCHAVPGKWHFMGVTLSAAGSLQWYHDTLTPNDSFEAIVAEAEKAPAGSEGLLFLPYLSGERTPYPDPLARGSFVGLTLRHGRAHVTRSVLEGVAFSMKDCFELLKGAGLGTVNEVRIAGGGAKGPLWRKIVASALGLPMVTVNSTEGGAYGAALLGGVGAGAWDSVETACDATIAVTGRDEPVAEWTKAYEELYPRYRELYPALKPTFGKLGT